MNTGVASINLSEIQRQRHETCFHTVRLALEYASKTMQQDVGPTDIPLSFPIITPDMDSASVTGYHRAGIHLHHNDNEHTPATNNTNHSKIIINSLSRYNAYREGFIFSNGEMFPFHNNNKSRDCMEDKTEDSQHEDDTLVLLSSFDQTMNTLFHSMHDDIACPILEAIATYLELNDKNWFQNTFGPTSLHSQWHVKRFVYPTSLSSMTCTTTPDNNNDTNNNNTDSNSMEWLPTHTDPSLISIIIHDAPYSVSGGMGLQYQMVQVPSHTTTTRMNPILWKEIPRHGHGIATILVGSILSTITGNVFPSAKHRVIYTQSHKHDQFQNHRIAATLFVRPRGDALFVSPPSHKLSLFKMKEEKILFSQWLKKVSRNYMKGKERDRMKERKNMNNP